MDPDARRRARQSRDHPDRRSATIKSSLDKIALALSSRRDNLYLAATAKMAILIVAAFPSRLSRYTNPRFLWVCGAHKARMSSRRRAARPSPRTCAMRYAGPRIAASAGIGYQLGDALMRCPIARRRHGKHPRLQPDKPAWNREIFRGQGPSGTFLLQSLGWARERTHDLRPLFHMPMHSVQMRSNGTPKESDHERKPVPEQWRDGR